MNHKDSLFNQENFDVFRRVLEDLEAEMHEHGPMILPIMNGQIEYLMRQLADVKTLCEEVEENMKKFEK